MVDKSAGFEGIPPASTHHPSVPARLRRQNATQVAPGSRTWKRDRQRNALPPHSTTTCLESQLDGVCAPVFGEGLLQSTHKMPLRASHLRPPSHTAHSARVRRVRRTHDRRNYGHAQKNEKAGRCDTVRTTRPGPPQIAYDAGPMRGS